MNIFVGLGNNFQFLEENMVNFRLLMMSALLIQSFNGYSMDILQSHTDAVFKGDLKINTFIEEFPELVINNNVSDKQLKELYKTINSCTSHYEVRIRILNALNLWPKYMKYAITEIKRLKSTLKKGSFSNDELRHIKSFKQYYMSKI